MIDIKSLSDEELIQMEKKVVKDISYLNNEQMAYKIALNSLYGATGNAYFRYFNIEIARAITLTGQFIIRYVEASINKRLNKIFETDNETYCIYCDTDSVYICLEPAIQKFCPGLSVEKTIGIMDKLCEDKIRDVINGACKDLQNYIGAFTHNISFKREVLADKGIWTAKKRYILNVHNSEGVQFAEPKIKVMGLEMVKSSTPAIIRDKLKQTVKVILSGNKSSLHTFVRDFRKEFNEMPVEDIAFPRGVNGLKQYSGSPIYAKGTPIHVRGALLHNHHLKRLGLTKLYQNITEGERIKFVYLRMPNPFQEDVIAFTQELPKEFGLHKFIDYDKMFEKVFLDALQIILDPIGWTAEEQSTLEDFFS